jgi:hypothetical protein
MALLDILICLQRWIMKIKFLTKMTKLINSPQQLRLKKIEKLLNEKFSLSTDKEVAYLLVEIRKVLEDNSYKDKFPYLSIFCDWALHIKLTKSVKSVEILKNLSKLILKNAKVRVFKKGSTAVVRSFVPGGRDVPTNKEPIVFENNNSALWIENLDKFTFANLRKDLRGFIKKYKLPEKVVMEDDSWSCFLDSLIFVLTDSKLMLHINNKYNGQVLSISKIRNIKVASLSIVIIPPNNEGKPRKYGYRNEIPWPFWKIEYDDGSSRIVPLIYSSLKHDCREPNLTGKLVGYGWKDGRLV